MTKIKGTVKLPPKNTELLQDHWISKQYSGFHMQNTQKQLLGSDLQ